MFIQQKKSSRNLKYKDFFNTIEEGLTKASPAEDDGLEFEDDEEGEATMQEEEEGDEEEDDQEEFNEE